METNQWHFGQRMETTTKSLGSMENAWTVNLLTKVMWKGRFLKEPAQVNLRRKEILGVVC